MQKLSLSFLIIMTLLSSGCKIVKDEEKTVSLKDFRVQSEISGWTEEDGSYQLYDLVLLRAGAMNGDADQYGDKGMIEGIEQKLVQDKPYLQLFIMDFGTAAAAASMFDVKAQQIAAKQTIGAYEQTVAVSTKYSRGGIITYAHFDKYYIELQFETYAEADFAYADAALFLAFYEEKL
ncbi:MAG: hypothetical protein HQK83_05670 [Fibrobacteria bacterium]|nr:hypothetical protein [Fibrobacteria bacterium]